MDRARRIICAVVAAGLASLTAAAGAGASPLALPTLPSTGGTHTSSAPAPGSPAYIQRDMQNLRNAYGRQTAPDGQLSPNFIAALPAGTSAYLQQIAEQAENPTRPIIDPGEWFPGWNQGNPYRASWAGARGIEIPIAFTNRYGALLHGDVWAPLPGGRDPYTHRRLHAPYPLVVITTGSVQGSEHMYDWAAEDLAERGYVVLTYDVQGQGTGETLPHQGPVSDIPFCNPASKPAPREQTSCPGVPFQQESNFIYGTEDAITFAESTPRHRYRNPAAGSAAVNAFNPLWRLIDRRPDRRSRTPGRHNKLAVISHSLGAAAITYLQGIDPRIETIVALDKLFAGTGQIQSVPATPKVPALALQSEYGFNVEPYWMMGSSSFSPGFTPPSRGPDPQREEKVGFDAWRHAGLDTMMIALRSSTHLEYTDINFALPASRYGQDVASHYMQAWIDKYVKHDPTADRRLLATRFTYLEPKGHGVWAPVTLVRADHLSFYFCSGLHFHTATGHLVANPDIAKLGGCK